MVDDADVTYVIGWCRAIGVIVKVNTRIEFFDKRTRRPIGEKDVQRRINAVLTDRDA